MTDLLKVAPYSKIRFYQLLKEQFGEQGKNAFFIGFHLYAFRKGIRCAQRAVSQGLPLDYNSYQLCRESVFHTAEARKDPGPQSKSVKEVQPGQIVSCNYGCSTKDCLREYDDTPELEELFCRNVDRMMVYAFNPEIGLGYEVTETFRTSDHCEHRCSWKGIDPDMPQPQRTEEAPPLAYLTWSSYASFAEMAISIFGQPGEAVAAQVKQEIIQKFGMDIWMKMEQYKGMNLDLFYRV